ncbi:MAG TPA: winged helix-turn-helix domain-containing protein [Candidatus Nanoarchaeia archaeon]|nr:winged helix-turn-helix domain-containing protein [Candidatus Nanoarchaeia archaeon]
MKSARIKERELIIKLNNEKRSTYDIARVLGISQTKASFWVRRYKKTGILENLPRSGRPTPLTKDELKSIASEIKSKLIEPKRTGINSKEVLQLIEHKISRKYTLRHAQRLLHKMGFSLVTPRVSHIRKDEKAQQKFREEFKKKPSRNMWAIQS